MVEVPFPLFGAHFEQSIVGDTLLGWTVHIDCVYFWQAQTNTAYISIGKC